MCTIRIASFVLCALSVFWQASRARGDEPTPVASVSELQAEGLRALEKGNRVAATDVADLLVGKHKDDARAVLVAGDLYLRAGRIHTSLKQFERYIALVPGDQAQLWQYGIALTLANRFDRGRELFELHRVVNSNDVENAAWHFLCVAKTTNLNEAKALVLPAPGDSRVPMSQIQSLLVDGNEQNVIDAVARLSEGSDSRRSADFYGKLYLGLYADAQGDATKAIKLVGDAVKIAEPDYMGDIARVYLAELVAEN